MDASLHRKAIAEAAAQRTPLVDRIEQLADALPPDGTVTLSRTDLRYLVETERRRVATSGRESE